MRKSRNGTLEVKMRTVFSFLRTVLTMVGERRNSAIRKGTKKGLSEFWCEGVPNSTQNARATMSPDSEKKRKKNYKMKEHVFFTGRV
jgi:hypothetical protein